MKQLDVKITDIKRPAWGLKEETFSKVIMIRYIKGLVAEESSN